MAQLRISRNDFNVVPVPHQAIPAYSLNFISVQALLIPQVDHLAWQGLCHPCKL